MLFDIEADHGHTLVAYVVPDTGGTTPSIRLQSNGVDLLTLAANELRPHLIAAGRHSTGRCGFAIDEALVPGLAGYADLEIREASRDILVYRRPPPTAIDGNIFRLETHLRPLTRLDEALADRFQYWYAGIDRFGRETSTQVFCLEPRSVFISGRLLLKNFEYYLIRGIKTVGILRDPFDELAERLILLQGIGRGHDGDAEAVLGTRDALTFAPVIASLQGYDLTDPAEAKRFFRRAPEKVLRALSNPLVRQLTTGAPDEMPAPSGVASALDALAAFEVLGVRSNAAAFTADLAKLAGVDPAVMPTIDEDPACLALGAHLRALSIVEDILEKDLEVFFMVQRAFDAANAWRS